MQQLDELRWGSWGYGRELLLDFTKNQDGQSRDIAETFIISDKSITTQR